MAMASLRLDGFAAAPVQVRRHLVVPLSPEGVLNPVFVRYIRYKAKISFVFSGL